MEIDTSLWEGSFRTIKSNLEVRNLDDIFQNTPYTKLMLSNAKSVLPRQIPNNAFFVGFQCTYGAYDETNPGTNEVFIQTERDVKVLVSDNSLETVSLYQDKYHISTRFPNSCPIKLKRGGHNVECFESLPELIQKILSEKRNSVCATFIYPNVLIVSASIPDVHADSLLYTLLKQVQPLCALSEAEFMTYVDNERNALSYAHVNAIVDRMIKEKIAQLEDASEQYQTAIQELSEAKSRYETAIVDIKELNNVVANVASVYHDQVESVLRLKGVERVATSAFKESGVLDVYTHNIYTTTQGHTYFLGKYRICLNFVDNEVQFFNTMPDMRRQSHWGARCHHPHVSTSGHACLGTASSSIATALAGFDIVSAVMTALSFLRSVNLSDIAGRHVANWPIVNENMEIIQDHCDLVTCCSCGHTAPEDLSGWTICSVCGQHVCETHSKTVTVSNHEYPVCNLCASNAVVTCTACQTAVFTKDAVPNKNSEDMLCRNCAHEYEVIDPMSAEQTIRMYFTENDAAEYLHTCSICNRTMYISPDSPHPEQIDTCEFCREGRKFVNCSICGAAGTSDDCVLIHNTDGTEQWICTECTDDIAYCCQCQSPTLISSAHYLNREQHMLLCDNCFHTLTSEEKTENNADNI